MLLEALSTARDLGRLHEIARALIRHGMGDLVRRLHIASILERAGRMIRWERVEGLSTRTPQENLRLLLEDLGPTAIKLGQILATRNDLLPPEWTAELSKLHEQSRPSPWDEVRAQLEEDLGAPPEEVFRDFDEEPLAAASIAQVHTATLEDGTRVVLKVRRPGIREVVEADLRLLKRLAERAEIEVAELRRFRPLLLVRQFARSLRDELDLRVEARNAERMRKNLAAERVRVPEIHGRWTRERLCVMERFDGPSIGAWLREGGRNDVDPKRIAADGARAVLRMILVDGFFHADPHPGNVVLLEDGHIGLLDFGMVGRLTQSRRVEFLRLLLSVSERDEEDLVDVLLGWSHGERPDVDLLTQDCVAFVDRYDGVPLKDLDVPALVGDVAALLRNNDLFLPMDVAQLMKVFVTLDGLGRALDPDFVMAEHIEPFAQKALREHASPIALMRRSAREVGRVLSELPRELRRMMRSLGQGGMRMEIGVRDLDAFGSQLDRSANRVTMGLVTSALIMGTAIALSVSSGPLVLGLPIFALLGFLTSMAAGVWLLWSIARSGRK